MVTKEDIKKGLKEIGIEKGDILFVHSSLSSFGYVERGAETVIESLMEVLGKDGTLAIPSFLSGLEYDLVQNNEIIFDVKTTPSGSGKITDTFWRYPEVKRSINPTHSVAAWGRRKEWFITRHEKCLYSCGKNSPFYKLCQANGKILFLGVGHSSNTTLHMLENINGAPTTSSQLFYPKVINYRNRVVTVPTYPHLPGLARDYEKMDKICKEEGIQKETKVGNSLWKLVDAGALYKIGSTLIKENPCFLTNLNFYQQKK